jgi:proteasome accessory factor B
VKLLRLKAGRDRPPYDFARRHGNSFRVFVSEKDPVEVRVKFSPKFAPMIAESFWHPSERKDTLEDGSLILSVTVSHPPEVVWWALQWGADAEVLSPPEMRQLAAETAAQMVAVYQKSIRGKHG